MFDNSLSPCAEGFRDGCNGVPRNRGYYGDAEWLDYCEGYARGAEARR